MDLGEQTVRWRTKNPILNTRTARELKSEEVAERLGVTRHQVVAWEMGDAAPDESQMAALGVLLGIETFKAAWLRWLRGRPRPRAVPAR